MLLFFQKYYMLDCLSTLAVDCSDALISRLTKGIFHFLSICRIIFNFMLLFFSLAFLMSRTLFLPLTRRQTKTNRMLFDKIESISFPNSSHFILSWMKCELFKWHESYRVIAMHTQTIYISMMVSIATLRQEAQKKRELRWMTKISSDDQL